MTKLNFNTLSAAQIPEAIDNVGTRSDTLGMDIHCILVAVAADWASCGDVREPVKHVNALIERLGKMTRKNALMQYATSPKLFGMVAHATEANTVVAGKMKHGDLDLRLIANTKWFDFAEPPAPKAWDVIAEYKKFVAKATQKAVNPKVIDKLDPELLTQLVAIQSTLEAADVGDLPN